MISFWKACEEYDIVSWTRGLNKECEVLKHRMNLNQVLIPNWDPEATSRLRKRRGAAKSKKIGEEERIRFRKRILSQKGPDPWQRKQKSRNRERETRLRGKGKKVGGKEKKKKKKSRDDTMFGFESKRQGRTCSRIRHLRPQNRKRRIRLSIKGQISRGERCIESSMRYVPAQLTWFDG